MRVTSILPKVVFLYSLNAHWIPVASFAGGFGAAKGGFDNVKKQKGSKSKKGGVAKIKAPIASVNNEEEKVKLDKWGLPAPTLEDLFPPMGPHVELIPVDPNRPMSLDDIENSLKDHMDLQLGRFFDEKGIEKKVHPGRDPMIIHLLHQSPPVLRIDNFFTKDDCELIKAATFSAHQVNSATFTGALSTRTSTSWFCRFEDVPLLLAKANHVLNIPLETMEEPQLVRYQKGQEFSWHYDEVPASQLNNGGQRIATLLVYLNDLATEDCGGGTAFRDLFLADKKTPLVMKPKQGSALLFFPAFRDGTPDDRTLHRSEVMTCDSEKWIVQMWVHKDAYQAVLPAGNTNLAARSKMEEIMTQLGYE